MAILVLRQPQDTRIEDFKTGVRFHRLVADIA